MALNVKVATSPEVWHSKWVIFRL